MNRFSQIGIALWGHANAPWARALKIDERTIRRFRTGDMEPPSGVWKELCGHLLTALMKARRLKGLNDD